MWSTRLRSLRTDVRRLVTTWSVQDLAPAVEPHADGATVRLRIVPRAPRTEVAGMHGDAVKVRVHAPPVDGAANQALRRHLAALAGVPVGDCELLQGERSRSKVVLVRGIGVPELLLALRGTSR